VGSVLFGVRAGLGEEGSFSTFSRRKVDYELWMRIIRYWVPMLWYTSLYTVLWPRPW